jgi:hypothetical protein
VPSRGDNSARARACRGRSLGALLAGGLASLLALPAPPAYALSVAATPISAVEGAPFAGAVATLDDMATVDCPAPAGYTATVTWADHTTSPGVVGAPARNLLDCAYPVSAAHTFAEEGAEPVTVVVAVGGPGGPGASAVSPATVADAPLTALALTPASVFVGAPFNGAVATFTDADPGASPADFTATIDWGDGATTPGATIAADAAGGFTVSAGHTYGRAAMFPSRITVLDGGGSAASAAGVISVTAPPPPDAKPPGAPPPAAQAPSGAPPHVGVSPPSLLGPDRLAVRLTCPPAAPRCRGVARVVTVPVRGPKPPLPGGASVGSALFVLAPGESRTVAVPVAKRLRRVLRRARSARLAGVAIAFGASGRSAAATGPSAVIRTTGLR